MKLRSVKEIKNLKGKRVLLRADFNVPLDSRGRITDDFKIKAGLATINYLLKKKASVIIITHLGRPEGKKVVKLSTRPIQKTLSKLLKQEVSYVNELVGPKVEEAAEDLKPGGVLLLENVRFSDREEVNCKRFAKKLAKLADYYVNEAFAVSHRKHSSLNAITKYLPAYAGLNLANEVLQLEKVLNSKVKPKVALIGGKKLTSKIGAVKNLLDKMDYVLLGGAAANNVLKAMDYEVGKSLIDKDSLPLAKRVLDNKLRMPIDVVVASSLKASAGSRVKAIGQLDSKDIILDIGPDTIQLYGEIIKEAKLVVWNGPLGYFEVKKYQQGSAKVAGQIAKAGSYSLAGGGETVQLIDELKLRTDFDFVSTGGGAMLEFLAGKILPGLRPLIK